VARAQSNPLVVQRLGAPINEGWFLSGSINVSTGAGDADVAVPISGPNGKGTVFVTAQKIAGIWTYRLMQAAIDGSGERIDLLASAAQVAPPASARATTTSSPTAPAGTPAATAAPTAAAAQPAAPQAATPAPLASQPFNQNPDLRCDVLEVRRVSGGALFVRWRLLRAAAAAGGGLVAGQPLAAIYHSWSWDGVYFTDPAENKKYAGLKDSGGQWISQGQDKNYSPGDQQVIWMKFPAPPPSSSKITFVFPGFPPFEDLLVS
jgi:hypothetical protein